MVVGRQQETTMSEADRPKIEAILHDVQEEVFRALFLHPRPTASAHEGLSVLEEEVAELRQIVYSKQRDRDLDEMRKEAVQVAAMAVKFVLHVCDEGRGRE
jgi:NTP pyrophosphatase (non-canonical NTP hydrolase)